MGSTNLKVDEPSMEDVLASIRRIISEDHEPAFGELEPSPLKTVLDIAERHLTSGFYPEVQPNAVEEESPPSPEDPFREEHHTARSAEEDEPAGRAHSSMETQRARAFAQPCERSPGEALMSRVAEGAVSEAFGQLRAARAASQSPTIEDLMKEMLRPMLKAWLDDNLPALVERLVRAEIERVTRG